MPWGPLNPWLSGSGFSDHWGVKHHEDSPLTHCTPHPYSCPNSTQQGKPWSSPPQVRRGRSPSTPASWRPFRRLLEKRWGWSLQGWTVSTKHLLTLWSYNNVYWKLKRAYSSLVNASIPSPQKCSQQCVIIWLGSQSPWHTRPYKLMSTAESGILWYMVSRVRPGN